MEKYTLRTITYRQFKDIQGKFLNKHTQFLHIRGKIVHNIHSFYIYRGRFYTQYRASTIHTAKLQRLFEINWKVALILINLRLQKAS